VSKYPSRPGNARSLAAGIKKNYAAALGAKDHVVVAGKRIWREESKKKNTVWGERVEKQNGTPIKKNATPTGRKKRTLYNKKQEERLLCGH